MAIAVPGVKRIARSEAVCSLLYMERSFMRIALNGVKHYAHCYTCSDALCSYLHMK